MVHAPQAKPDLYYFCDESSQVKDHWLAVGGIAIMRSAIPRIVADLQIIKAQFGKTGEVKWENAKSYGGRVHKAYIDYLFVLIQTRKANFHIRFSDMNEYDHGLSGPRKKTDTVSKSFYQLLLHRPVRYYHGKASVSVFPDDGDCTAQLPDNLAKLRAEAGNNWGQAGRDCISKIECRASKTEPLLQLLDVTLGALAAFRNGRHLNPEYSQVKRELAEYALAKTGWPEIGGCCSISRKSCNRWTVTPKLKRGQRR